MDSREAMRLANRVLELLKGEHAMDESRGHLSMDNWEWPTGVALYGIYKVYDRTGDESMRDYLTEWYDVQLQKPEPHKNVNTVGPMLALTCLYERTKNPAYLPHIERWIGWVMREMPRTEYGGLQHNTAWNRHYQQLWDDTLFMTVLFLLKAGYVLDRPELVEEAKYQFLIHIKYLQDKVTGLFYHGWTFDRRHNFAGAFWARGNSWFTAAAVEFLELVGLDDASARFVRAALEDQVLALWKLQRENGLFNTLLDVEECYLETSATAAIAYGVLKGVRLGYLPDMYAEMAVSAARAVIGQIAEDGSVMGVSGGTGMGKTVDHYKQIEICVTAYGQGLTFLMLTEFLSDAAY